MNEHDYLIILYDYYCELFNDNQRELFEWYYFDNLSLSEIAYHVNKSRNAIHKGIKNVCEKLYFYEDKLKIYEKNKKIKEIILEIKDDKIRNKIEEFL